MPNRMPWPVAPPLAAPPRPGSGALLPTLGSLVVNATEDRQVSFATNPESCGASFVISGDPCAAGGTKTIDDNEPEITAWDFAVWAGDRCAPYELGRPWAERATRQLAATISYQVAHELWTGDQATSDGAPQTPLASLASDVLTDGPTSSTDALAVLEYGLGQCARGQRGVIHATRHAATYWGQLGLIRREGNMLLTWLDTVVIADAGYDGSGPEGQPAEDGSQWAYATLFPMVRLGPERLIPDADDIGAALNRATNTIEYRAERKAAVAFPSCCLLAAELDLGWADIGGAGS